MLDGHKVTASTSKGALVQPTAGADRFAIRELVENWALWRDAGNWERFAAAAAPAG